MRKYCLLVWFLVITVISLNAQFLFSSLGTKDGMSSRDVRTVCKDKEGFIWFGTSNGLNRYDGSGFKIYNRQRKNCRQLTNDFIYSVEVAGNNILLGTPSGLFLLDKKADTIRQVHSSQQKPPVIFRLLKDANGQVWAFSDKAVFIFRNDSMLSVNNVYPKTKNTGCQYEHYNIAITDSLRKGIWFSNNLGLFFFHQPAGELYYAGNNPFNWQLLNMKGLTHLAVDGAGKLWYTDSSTLISLYDFSSNKSRTLNEEGIAYPAMLNTKNYINGLFSDSRGRIWIANWLGHLMVTSGPEQIILVNEQSVSGYNIANALINTVFTDDKKNDWFISKDGVYRLLGESYFDDITQLKYDWIKNKPWEFAAINRVTKARNGSWWICTEAGLFLYDSKTKSQQRISISKDNIRQNRFFSILLYNGEWWCGTGDGIKIYNPQTKQFRKFAHYTKGFEIVNRSVTNLLVDKNGKLWFSVWADALYCYDPVNNTTERFDGKNRSQGEIQPLNCSSIQQDREGNIWVTSDILRKFDYSTHQWLKPYKPSSANLFEKNLSYGIAEDMQGNKWIGVSQKGIYLLSKEGELIDSVNTTNGLSSDLVFEVLLDKQNRLWAVTSEAVHYINLQNKYVSTLDFRAPHSFGDFWPVLTADDNKLTVTYNDITCFVNIDKLGSAKTGAKPLITSIRVFESDMPFDFAKPELHLKYSQNFFTIDFSSPVHNEIPSIQYAYKLEGLNSDWVYCGKRQVASFSNLTNGRYRFLVKATDKNGEWNEDAAIVSVTIKPPFWKKAWFIAVIISLIVIVAFTLYRRRKNRQKQLVIDKTIDYFANSDYGDNPVDEIRHDIIRNCTSQLGFDHCEVYLENQKPDKPIVLRVTKTGKTEIINNAADNNLQPGNTGYPSEMAVPLLHEGNVTGVIYAVKAKKNFFTQQHSKAVSTIASISANKIAETQARQKSKENELKLLDINRMLAETKLMALRAQMNPHFVFNCLNSIQECIIRQKYAEASNYLNKFSKLFRLVLNNSSKQLVSIAEEKEVLDLYLQLELMRFENKFQYKISTDEKLDTDDTLIPSMLLQPFAENALWHGLLHKDSERELLIEFKLISKEVFSCIIDDTGIGRKKAAEIKEHQGVAKKHESKGLSITMDRIQLLQKQGHHATIKITDKQNEKGEAAGTRVTIELSTDITS